MPLPDPKAIAYWCKCSKCLEIHVATSHHVAICGNDWHKPDCPFVKPGGLFVTFNAYPIYHKRDKIFRQLTPEWQKFFLDQQAQRLKGLQKK